MGLLVWPAGRTRWTDQLDRPVHFIWSLGQFAYSKIFLSVFTLSQLPSLTNALFSSDLVPYFASLKSNFAKYNLVEYCFLSLIYIIGLCRSHRDDTTIQSNHQTRKISIFCQRLNQALYVAIHDCPSLSLSICYLFAKLSLSLATRWMFSLFLQNPAIYTHSSSHSYTHPEK